METRNRTQGVGKSGEISERIWSSSSSNQDHDQLRASSTRPACSYTCYFCKKGFSNAQALGGHMNIHRRDRAKLRQSSSNEEKMLQSLDMEGGDNLEHQPTEDDSKRSESSEDDKIQTLKTPLIDHDHSATEEGDEDDMGEEIPQRQLQFFDDKPLLASLDDGKEGVSHVGGDDQSFELDLELRLGPAPR
ncbi:hypothetical protein Nepgr_012014 [Nepenthes gracilis]|uniref:C2H2-type domain-containing protein n=1 Tax=Nepenthes gracilis TaxID=150966 RepID=A0AAD3SF88_NEPGR|nr:hypothetical protein Nepgr_012014 [Nepenthes gracilis]